MARRTKAAGLAVVVTCSAYACSPEGHPPYAETNPGLGCGRRLAQCDIHDEGCRQDVLDVVACLRGYDEQVRQPPATFITLDELLDGADEPEPEGASRVRLGYSLMGLISDNEVSEGAAQMAQADSIAAFYSPADNRIYVLENPGGEALTEERLGVPVDTYLMSVLAHEYVHFLQDLELDLDDLQEELPTGYDSALAVISAVEGEAVLYEGFFNFAVGGGSATEDRMLPVLESFVDYAEVEIRSVPSPLLEARGLFPYTYGAHSAALLYFERDAEAVAELQESTSTLSYLQRRWSTVRSVRPFPFLQDQSIAGLNDLGSDTVGPWLVGALWSRVWGASTDVALELALQWRGDQLTVWEDPPSGEVLVRWVIDLDGATKEWIDFASVTRPAPGAATWLVGETAEGRLALVASNVQNSEGAELLLQLGETKGTPRDAGVEPQANGDAGAEPGAELEQSLRLSATSDQEPDERVEDALRRLRSRLQAASGRGLTGPNLRLPAPGIVEQREAMVRVLARRLGARRTAPEGSDSRPVGLRW